MKKNGKALVLRVLAVSILFAACTDPRPLIRVDPACNTESYGGPDSGGRPLPGGEDSGGNEPLPGQSCEEEIAEPQVLYLSADDSNSMASPVIVRALIGNGFLVPSWAVRTYEFTNYYDIDYAPAVSGRVNVFIHMKPDEGEDLYNLQIGARAHDIAFHERRPLNLTFIMDTSGSMGGMPIQLEREVCLAVASSLRTGDIVSMVVWSVSNATVLDSHRVGPLDVTLEMACRGLDAGGGTNLHGGLTAGYDLAAENYDPGYLNRVILVSDGQANVGITDETIIAGAAEDEEGEGIYLVGVGVGNGYNDTLMDAVTDAGKGAYVFIDTYDEAYKIFSDRFLSTLEIAVMDVQVELTLPPWLRIQEFHGEEISTDPKEVEPQHLAPDDAMIYHQLVKSCTEPVLNDEVRAVARYTDPVTRHRHTDEKIVTIAQLLDSRSDAQLVKGTAVVEYAEGLKNISDLMEARDEAAARDVCSDLSDSLHEASDETGDVELAQISDLLDLYCSDLTTRTTTAWY